MAPRKSKPGQPKEPRRVTFHKKRVGEVLHELMENMYILGLDVIRQNQWRPATYELDGMNHIIALNCKHICDLSDSLQVIV